MLGQLEQQAAFQNLLFNTISQLYIKNLEQCSDTVRAANKAVDQGHALMKRLGIPLKVAAPALKESDEGAEPDSRYTGQ